MGLLQTIGSLSVNCRQTVKLNARAAGDDELTTYERFGLKIHTLICAPCRLYLRQLEAMRGLTSRLDEQPRDTSPTLDDDARARIRQRLRDATKDPAQ